MQRMTDLLFGEQGVFHIDLGGRLNSAGSQLVYQNRGGLLPRKHPTPDITALYDGLVMETDNWNMTV